MSQSQSETGISSILGGKSRIFRVTATVFMVAVIITGATIVPVGYAVADDQCSPTDDFVAFFTFGAVDAAECIYDTYSEDSIDEMKESDANQTKTDIYTAGSGLKGGSEAFASPYDNYLQDTETIAWTKAEAAIAQAYENGSSKAEAKVAAKEAISEYYATKQINLIEQSNVTLRQMEVLREQAVMEDDIGNRFVNGKVSQKENGSTNYLIDGDVESFDASTDQITLVNGTNHGVKEVQIKAEMDRYSPSTGNYAPLKESGLTLPKNEGSQYQVTMHLDDLTIEPPNDNYEQLSVSNMSDHRQRWAEIESQNSNLQSESDAFVEATWEDYETGKINSSDVISRTTAMFEYGTESGDLYQSTASLALAGFDTPNLNQSGTMDVTYNGATNTGLLMARNAPNGSWEAGTTYNTSNIDGPVFLATTDGEKIDFEDGRQFTVESLTSKDGTSIESVDTTDYNYQTTNTSELNDKIDRLIELRQEIEDREPDGTGGAGGFLPDLGVSSQTLIVAAAALVALGFLKD